MSAHKLVRDRIPEMLPPLVRRECRRASDTDEQRSLLRRKLREEIGEYLSSESPDELIDVLEVTIALASSHGWTAEALEAARQRKAEERGAFREFWVMPVPDDERG